MKIERTVLLRSLAIVKQIIPNKSILPILECFKLEFKKEGLLVITGFDLENYICLEVKIKHYSDLSFCVNANDFYSIINAQLDSELDLLLEDNHLKIVTHSGEYQIGILNASDYPLINNDEQEHLESKELLLDDISESIRKALNFINKDSAKLAFQGIGIGRNGIYSTNSSALYFNNSISFDNDYILGEKFCKIISKLQDDTKLELLLTTKMAIAKIGNMEIGGRLLDDTFPNINVVIPKDLDSIEIDNDILLNSSERLSTLNGSAVEISLSKDGCLQASNFDLNKSGKEKIFLKGLDCDLSFNSKFLQMRLRAIPDGEIFYHSNKIVLIKNENETALFMCIMSEY